MKRFLIALTMASTFILSAGVSAATSTTTTTALTVQSTTAEQANLQAGAIKLTFDPQHTYVLWHINHFGFSDQSGKWYASGTLLLDKKNMKNTKLDVTININDVITGIPELDAHLKGESFFNTNEYPTATFVSDKVILTGKNTAKVNGMLTLHGETKPVTLNVKLNKEGVNPISQKQTFGFSATTKIKRTDFGLKAYVPGLSDNVDIEINSEAYNTN